MIIVMIILYSLVSALILVRVHVLVIATHISICVDICCRGGGGSDGERDVQMGRERSEKSTARGAEGAGDESLNLLIL